MKLSFWDILASMVMLAGLALATIFINIFINPYSFINPFPPPTPIATLDVPTLTPSLRVLPDLWTTTPGIQETFDMMGTPSVTAGGPTVTGTITGTVFVLPTKTVTPTPPNTPTFTKTFSKTPNKTLTVYYLKTATMTATKTQEGASGDKIPPTTPGNPYSTSLASDPNPVFSWAASSDTGGSGLAGYHVTWGLDSGGNNTMYKGTATTFVSPTLTTPGIYYFYVRAYDEAGNQSAWAGPARFGYTGFGAPSAVTNAATGVTSTGATLRGTVSANGYSTTVTFNYGTTTSYGTTVTAAESPVSSSSTSVSYVLSGLTPATTYHFRVSAINAGGGPINGSDITFTTLKADQAALTITDPGIMTYGGGSATLTTTGGSGTGAVTYDDGSSTGCTVTTGGVLTVTNASGTCNIVATKAADATYNARSSASLAVTLAKANQAAITFTDPGPVAYQDTVTLTASGGSGTGAFSYDATGSTGCTIASVNELTVTDNTGTCDVVATKAADNNYNAASSASTAVSMTVATQTTLVVDDPGSLAFGSTTTLTTSGGSGTGAVTFDIGGSTGCSLSGDDLTITDNTGSCAVTATKAADANYMVATSASQTITMVKADQTIGAISPTSGSVLAGSAALSPTTASSGLAVVFASTTPAVCTVSGTNVIYNIEGTCSVTANQAGDANYNAAPQVNGTITVGP